MRLYFGISGFRRFLVFYLKPVLLSNSKKFPSGQDPLLQAKKVKLFIAVSHYHTNAIIFFDGDASSLGNAEF